MDGRNRRGRIGCCLGPRCNHASRNATWKSSQPLPCRLGWAEPSLSVPKLLVARMRAFQTRADGGFMSNRSGWRTTRDLAASCPALSSWLCRYQPHNRGLNQPGLSHMSGNVNTNTMHHSCFVCAGKSGRWLCEFQREEQHATRLSAPLRFIFISGPQKTDRSREWFMLQGPRQTQLQASRWDLVSVQKEARPAG
jgi:hypothetical protein